MADAVVGVEVVGRRGFLDSQEPSRQHGRCAGRTSSAGKPSSTSRTASTKPSSYSASAVATGLAFAECMRSQGVPSFPDPNASGSFTVSHIGYQTNLHIGGPGINRQSPAFLASFYGVCHTLLPGAGPPPGTASPAAWEHALAAAKYMRAHEVPNFPDPARAYPPPPPPDPVTWPARYSSVANRLGLAVRLFLSSFRVSEEVPELVEFAGQGARVAVTANALDNLPEFPRQRWMEEERTLLGRSGLCCVDLDLRAYYGEPEAPRSPLAAVDMIWATARASALRRCEEWSERQALPDTPRKPGRPMGYPTYTCPFALRKQLTPRASRSSRSPG